jgi:hypothetical protein
MFRAFIMEALKQNPMSSRERPAYPNFHDGPGRTMSIGSRVSTHAQ